MILKGLLMRIVSVDIDPVKAKSLKFRGWSFDWSKGAADFSLKSRDYAL
jgi:hypothetical protein